MTPRLTSPGPRLDGPAARREGDRDAEEQGPSGNSDLLGDQAFKISMAQFVPGAFASRESPVTRAHVSPSARAM